MNLKKISVDYKAIAVWIGLALLAFWLFRPMEFKNETNNQIREFTEKPKPTPTGVPKLSPSYYYGKASWYGQEICQGKPCRTANGDWFDENAFTCACSDDFPLGTKLTVSYEGNFIEVVCNDRGIYFDERHGRILDLTKAAFKALAPDSKGVIWVRVKEVK